MLSAPLDLGKVDATHLFDYLYQFFHRDFVASKTYLNGTIWIDPRSHRLEDGKEADFWHLTSREHEIQEKVGNSYVMRKERLPDFSRSARIEWVKQILENNGHSSVQCFYHQESNAKRNIRLYLWAHAHNFVVILQKLGRTSTFLVTSFYIDNEGKQKEFRHRYQRYQSGNAPELKGCEWFSSK